MATKAKYTRVPATSDLAEKKADTDIILRRSQAYGKYVGRALTLFFDEKKQFVVLRGTDRVIERVIWVAEVLKRKVAGLHQVTRLSEQQIVDIYEPKEEGLIQVQVERYLTIIEILLTKEPNAAQKAEPGYQAPIATDESEVLTPEKWEEDKKHRAERRERREHEEEHREERGERRERRERRDEGERPERREGGERRRGGRTDN